MLEYTEFELWFYKKQKFASGAHESRLNPHLRDVGLGKVASRFQFGSDKFRSPQALADL